MRLPFVTKLLVAIMLKEGGRERSTPSAVRESTIHAATNDVRPCFFLILFCFQALSQYVQKEICCIALHYIAYQSRQSQGYNMRNVKDNYCLIARSIPM